jgi:hypothetical protein
MALCFFCNVDDGIEAFLMTVLLSARTFDAPSSGTPIIRILNLRALINSVATHNAKKSDPNVEVFCAFENQMIGALLR